jgi:hypothetical protein
MTKYIIEQQFRVLYREFLFRMVDLELLSAHAQGDIDKLLGQFASLLIIVSILSCAGATVHTLVSNMMLTVGLFAVLCWDSTFPDRRDVLVLAPLPIRASTMFVAKVAALATALSVTVITLNFATGLWYPLLWMPTGSGLFGAIRAFAAYWITMFLSGIFIFCSVLSVQGIASQLLSRRRFLRVSAFLQIAAFCLFISVYFLEPSRIDGHYPTYWFAALFDTLNGTAEPALVPLTRSVLIGLSIVIFIAGSAFFLSYLRTIRRIVEEPDIVASARGFHWSLPFGNRLQTAVVLFSVRTLLRSRRHRVTLAFYLGIAFALIILFLKNPVLKGQVRIDSVSVPLLVSSVVLMSFAVLGTRLVFAMPLDLRANWIFRMTEVRRSRDYFAAIRRPLFVIAVAPVWILIAIIFLAILPTKPGAGHLALLALWGIVLAYLFLYGFHKIPFTCSYLPGKSLFHMAFLGGVGFMLLVIRGTVYELGALKNPAAYVKMLVIFMTAAALSTWRTVANARDAVVQFEDVPEPDVFTLGLYRDGVMLIPGPPETSQTPTT